MILSNSFTLNSEYLRVTSHGVYSKEEGWFFIYFHRLIKTMPVSKGQYNSIYICNKFFKN